MHDDLTPSDLLRRYRIPIAYVVVYATIASTVGLVLSAYNLWRTIW
jgi:Na+-translocating ferredoxin:NAD+ oxidoreductase RnfE subunit